MEESASPYAIVFRSPHRKASMDSRLVLESVGIQSELIRSANDWIVVVERGDEAASIEELKAYRMDSMSDHHPLTRRSPVFGGAIAGACCYALVIVSIFTLAETRAYEMEWFESGCMRAGDVMSGQLWRTVTALTLHVDLSHLMSNLAFGIFFGILAGRILGGGVAWLTILLAGSLGNLMNAIARDASHTSIGASTAVFSALGILVAHAFREKFSMTPNAMKRWSPLIAGVLLLAFIGVGGERTDVGAHVTGFIAGMVVGWIGVRLPTDWLDRKYVQEAAGCMAAAILIASWLLAFSLRV